jgi:N-sulfoglucosamine sulfohydrolase
MRAVLFVVAAVVLSLTARLRAADVPARPNVVLFVSDDHGQDAGCYGNPVVKTPNIDALAADGVLYRNAFCTTASCSASRSVILTGLHNHLNGQYGHTHHFHHFSSFSTVYSLPAILADNGYRTGRIGKFHVAPETVYRFDKVLPSADGSRNGVAMADNCQEFIADKSKPFFLYFCVTDPHRGGGLLKDKPGSPDAFGSNKPYVGVTETVYDPEKINLPSWLPNTPAARAEWAMYYQAITRADQGVGRLVQRLKEAGQWENTVFIYTADNGAAMPGSKTTLYEPGMKLPLVVRAPGLKERNVQRNAMISWVDLTPTILDFAGVKEVLAPPVVQGEPEDAPRNPRVAERAKQKVPYVFHGRSFRPTLDAEPKEGWTSAYASHTFHEIQMYYPMRVVRGERYKLIYNIAHPLPFPFASDLYESSTWQSALKDGGSTFGKRRIQDFIQRPKYELYDLQTDPDEAHNLAADPAHKATLDKMIVELKQFQKNTRDPWITKHAYE